jgi:hypothetical protein
MDVGTMTLHHNHGDEVLGLSRADLLAFATAEGVWLRFEAGTGPRQGPTSHSAEVGIRVPALDLGQLVGKRLYVPRGYDPAERQDPLATFDEYRDLDDNEVEILSLKGDEVHVRWTALVQNPDERGSPQTRMEINGRFSFRGLVQWETP